MQIQGNVSVSGIRQTEQANQQQLTLRQGDVLQGEVVRIDEGTAVVRLSGGGTMLAQMDENVRLSIGQRVELTVAGTDGDRIVMRLSGENGPATGVQVTAVLPQLTAAQQQAAHIYGLMREYGVSPTRDAFSRVQTLMESFPGMDERTAVFLCANLKEILAGSDSSLRALASALMHPAEGGVTASLHALMAALSFEPGDARAAQALLSAVPPNIAEAAGRELAAQQASGSAQIAQDGTPDRAGTQAMAKFLQQAAPEGYRYVSAQGRLADASAVLRFAASLPPGQADAMLRAFAQSIAPPGGQAPQDLLPALQRALGALTEGAQPIASPEGTAPQQTVPQQGQASATTVPIPQEAVNTARAANPMPPQAAQASQAGEALPQQPINGQIAQGSAQSARSAASTTTVSDLSQMADSLFARLPGEGDAGAELRRVTETMLRNLNTLREAISAMPGREPAAAAAYQADSRAQALPQIMQFHYIQIPIELHGQRRDADLYAMRRPGKRRDAAEECTILIALETEHLGRVEAIVRATGQDVSITFRMRPGDAAEAVRVSLPELMRSVDEAGFRLRDAAVTDMDEPVTPQTFLPMLEQLEDGAASRLDVRV